MKSRLSYLSHAMQVPLAGHSQEAAAAAAAVMAARQQFSECEERSFSPA